MQGFSLFTTRCKNRSSEGRFESANTSPRLFPIRVPAIADLSAHAGAQEVAVRPDGVLYVTSVGERAAASYFLHQAPAHITLGGVSCGRHQGCPACLVTATSGPPVSCCRAVESPSAPSATRRTASRAATSSARLLL